MYVLAIMFVNSHKLEVRACWFAYHENPILKIVQPNVCIIKLILRATLGLIQLGRKVEPMCFLLLELYSCFVKIQQKCHCVRRKCCHILEKLKHSPAITRNHMFLLKFENMSARLTNIYGSQKWEHKYIVVSNFYHKLFLIILQLLSKKAMHAKP